MYPVKTGAYPNHTRIWRPGTISIVQRLKACGYRVALAGKTHIAPKKVFPFEYLGDPINFTKTRSFVTSCTASGTPFCIVYASHFPHSPWKDGNREQYPRDKLKLFSMWADTPETRADYQAYLAETSVFDDEVAKGLADLEAAGVTSNTLVMVLSEQGSSQPWGKWNLYDQGIQSACVVRWPGKVKAAAVSDAMVEYVDVVPTFVDAAGGELTDDLDGRSFLHVLLGKADKHKDYTYAISTMRGINNGSDHYGMRSVRTATHKLIWNFTPEEPLRNGSTLGRTFTSWVRKADAGDTTSRAMVDHYLHRSEYELYDVKVDPFETRNLADDPALAEVKADLRKNLEAWMKQQGDKGQATEMEALKHQTLKRQQRMAEGARKTGKKSKAQKKRKVRSSKDR
jgi:uncharacterized sulfatase